MPRSIEITVQAEKTESLLAELERLDGVVGVSVHRNAGVRPLGDVVTIRTTNEGIRVLLDLAAQTRLLDGGSIVTSQPRSLLSLPDQDALNQESNETIWEEMAFLLRRDTNVSVNYLSTMAVAGGIAAVGLLTDTLHLVIGAMVIAPAFEPLLRIPFGLIASPGVMMSRGIASAAFGYLSLALGGAIVLLTLQLLGPESSRAVGERYWVQYWSTVGGTSILTALLAGAAGAVIITAQRSVLTAGVMIALALVPSMAIVGMGVASGDWSLAGSAILRWIADAAAVLLAGLLVLSLKQWLQHRRRVLG